MSEYYTDKNGFTARVGEDWNDEKSDQTLAYLTSPRTKFSKEDNSSVIVVNGELTTENEVKKRIEKEEAAKKLNPIVNRIVEYSNIGKTVKQQKAPSSIEEYHQQKKENKPIKKVVSKKIEAQKPDPIISDPITAEDTYKPKLLDEPTWNQIRQGFRDKAKASIKEDEERARKEGGLVWLNWRNPII
jgi:hypothetical protein